MSKPKHINRNERLLDFAVDFHNVGTTGSTSPTTKEVLLTVEQHHIVITRDAISNQWCLQRMSNQEAKGTFPKIQEHGRNLFLPTFSNPDIASMMCISLTLSLNHSAVEIGQLSPSFLLASSITKTLLQASNPTGPQTVHLRGRSSAQTIRQGLPCGETSFPADSGRLGLSVRSFCLTLSHCKLRLAAAFASDVCS